MEAGNGRGVAAAITAMRHGLSGDTRRDRGRGVNSGKPKIGTVEGEMAREYVSVAVGEWW